tara:strand:- start:7761 stop:8966 length:1206 start_codon:yes stop_codon:yes gene_type:complete
MDGFRLYNSKSRTKELFSPLNKGRATMYVCGITPYDVGHLGHALVYSVQDTLHRWLEFSGYEVTHIQNITDIDDDMIRKSVELDISISDLTEQNHSIYLDEMDALNVMRPDQFPLVSDYIQEIIESIIVLEKQGFAYYVDGYVFFNTSNTRSFGVLSGYSFDKLSTMPRTDTMPDEPEHLKVNSSDFLLWQPSEHSEAMYESPWGNGRPGWHIECSVMARSNLGDQFDIHGGGKDLAYPHHDSEIVQTESLTGVQPSVSYWVHNGTMQLKGEKMSKSLGNLVKVHELLNDGFSGNAIRLSLLMEHYRVDRNFSEDYLNQAQNDIELFKNAIKNNNSGGSNITKLQPLRNVFMDAMDDDLNTPLAIDTLRDLAVLIVEDQIPSQIGVPALLEMTQVLGIDLN